MSRLPMGMLFPEQTTSGISRTADGDRVVAASRRPDGTFRKALKIRPGFTPQEDVSLFRPQRQLEADAHRAAKGAVPGLKPNPLLQAALSGMGGGQSTKAQRKNAKRKEKRDEDKGAASTSTSARGQGKDEREEDVPDAWDADDALSPPTAEAPTAPPSSSSSSGPTPSSSSAPAPSTPAPASADPDPEETAKRIRALRKKLKQAQQLRERQAAGLYLPPAEKDKVDKMQSLEDELAQLTLTLTGSA
ncbi:hypothetical protein JCM1840_004486 [Sporobolomyces johnsonii]